MRKEGWCVGLGQGGLREGRGKCLKYLETKTLKRVEGGARWVRGRVP